LTPESHLRSERAITLVLRYGSLVSTLIMAVGSVLAAYRGIGLVATSHSIHPEVLLSNVLHFDPLAITELGILLLLFTPIARIVVALLGFAMERDWKYTLISLGVLAIVLLSISFAVEA
jgi:uncharacterized membrane protein